MIVWSRKVALAAGVGIILGTNAVALIGVAHNRSDSPESRLTLTERELQLPRWNWFESDNTGIGLRVIYRLGGPEESGVESTYPYNSTLSPPWLDKAKLAELGFEVTRPLDTPEGRRYYAKLLEKHVLLVLEYNGPAYSAALARAKRHYDEQSQRAAQHDGVKELARRRDEAQRNLDRERRARSRLFVVDAGLDLASLRARYPDKSRYAVATGRIRPVLETSKGDSKLVGWVSGLDINTIHVPYAYRDLFIPLLNRRRGPLYDSAPRFEVEITYGQRLEPWVTGAQRLARPQQ